MAVYGKELYHLFASPVFYVVAFVFFLLGGYFFYSSVVYYNMISMQAVQDSAVAAAGLNLTDKVVRPLFGNMSIILLLVAPLVSMRLYAEERKSGTLELLFTYPVSDRATLAAKYSALITVLVILLAGMAPCMLALACVADPNWYAILCAWLGLLLLGAAFLSLGLFTSSLAQNQVVAAVLAFGALLLFWVIGWAQFQLPPWLGSLAGYLSIVSHYEDFAKGVLDSRDIAYYVAFTVFFLFLTLRRVKAYRRHG
jgi:ABC-2 type transport system permease protein